MGERITRAELARRLDISRQRVHQLVRAGKITLGADGLVDIDVAASEYELNTDISRRSIAAQTADAVAQDVGMQPLPQPPSGAQGRFDFHVAKARKEEYNADMSELKLLRARGELVSRDEVEAREFAIARLIRDRVLGWPAKLANYVPPDAMKTIEKEADNLIADMQLEIKRVIDAE